MIGHFPDAFPDELFYNICARFVERTEIPSLRLIYQLLFGGAIKTINAFLPRSLMLFEKSLPKFHSLNSQVIIHYHTLYRYFSPFMNSQERERLLDEMRYGKESRKGASSILSIGSTHRWHSLNFCPECLKQDRKEFGKCYWHTKHQLPGVFVCPIHKVWLEEFEATSHRIKGASFRNFLSAEKCVKNFSSRPLDMSNVVHQFLCEIAEDAYTLLENPIETEGISFFTCRYIPLLIERGFASPQQVAVIYKKQTIHLRKLVPKFEEYLKRNLRGVIPLDNSKAVATAWLSHIFDPDRANHNPFEHLVFIHFIEKSIESFKQLPVKYLPFGNGPWPCLNTTCQIKHSPTASVINIRIKGRKVIGTFKCEKCSYTYKRIGPDTNEADRFKKTRVVDFGDVWRERLRSLWGDKSITILDLQKELGCSYTTILFQAVKIGLSSPRFDSNKMANVVQLAHKRAKRITDDEKTEIHHERWIDYISHNSDANFKELRNGNINEYEWLRQNDPLWLQEHMPKLDYRSQENVELWQERDDILSEKVMPAAERIKNRLDFPLKITYRALSEETGEIGLLRWDLKHLPKTKMILDVTLDSIESYALRKIQWVKLSCLNTERKIIRSELIEMAKIQHSLLKNPTIAVA